MTRSRCRRGNAAASFARLAGAALAALTLFAARSATATPPETAAVQVPQALHYGRFGAISIYRSHGDPREVVLFVSGDGGWDPGLNAIAQRLADKGAIVAAIDIRHYLAQLEKASEKCVSPAADLENLSRFLQSELGLKKYLQPTLVGYSSGATLVYATQVQAPDGLFKGALSIGFCPNLDLQKSLCKGSGLASSARRDANGHSNGVDFLPARELSGKWIALQGDNNAGCAVAPTRKFIAAVPGGEIVMLPKVAHGHTGETDADRSVEAAFGRLTASPHEAALPASSAPVADLPLTLVSAVGSGKDWFGVFLTGDGGWVGLDKAVSAELARHGIPVVGWDSLRYFWSPRTPDGASKDLDRVLRHFSRQLGKSHALLIGYSQGADTMPFMVNRLPAASRQMVGLTTLLGISDNALFEFHVANWLGNDSGGLPTAPELERWRGSPYLCLYGQNDADAACKELTGRDGSALELPGGHHFGGGYTEIADVILSRLPNL